MSYERRNSTDRLEQYRARQEARIEAMNRAIDEGRTSVVVSAAPAEESPRKVVPAKRLIGRVPRQRLHQAGVMIHGKSGHIDWRGSRKSLAAETIHSSLQNPLQVRAAAPITVTVQLIGSDKPLDGQLFSYDAKSEQLVPISKAEVRPTLRVGKKKIFKPLGSQPTKVLVHKAK